MIILLKLVSFAGLLLTLAPSFFVFYENISFEQHKTLMIIGTLLWMGTAPFWINRVTQKNDRR